MTGHFKKIFLVFPLLVFSLKAYDFSAVDSLIDDSIQVFRSNMFMQVEKGGTAIFKTSRGTIDSLTRMRIASASKWFSGAIILGCVDRGIIGLDDSLGKYLPAFTGNNKGAITIRQCFEMSSGLFGGTKYEQEPLYTLARCADSIALYTPLAFTPGAAWAYDGNGMQAAARAVEVASGKTWRTLAKEVLFTPCGMDSSGYDYYLINPWIAGGVQTTPVDYMKFLRMIIQDGYFDGVRVLSQQAVETMFSSPNFSVPLYSGADPIWPVSHPAYQYGMDTVRYGFGSWVVTCDPATRHVESISSPGYWGTAPWADRCRGLTAVIFMDGGVLGPQAYYTEISIMGLVRDAVGGGCSSSTLFRQASTPRSRLSAAIDPRTVVYSLNGRKIGSIADLMAVRHGPQGISIMMDPATRSCRVVINSTSTQ